MLQEKAHKQDCEVLAFGSVEDYAVLSVEPREAAVLHTYIEHQKQHPIRSLRVRTALGCRVLPLGA